MLKQLYRHNRVMNCIGCSVPDDRTLLGSLLPFLRCAPSTLTYLYYQALRPLRVSLGRPFWMISQRQRQMKPQSLVRSGLLGLVIRILTGF
jgi:hypothetical protein